MKPDELKKILAEITSTLTPVTAKMKATAKGEIAVEEKPPTPPLPPPPAPAADQGGACVSKDFKKVINAFKPDFIGQGGAEVQSLVIEFLGTYPECS